MQQYFYKATLEFRDVETHKKTRNSFHTSGIIDKMGSDIDISQVRQAMKNFVTYYAQRPTG